MNFQDDIIYTYFKRRDDSFYYDYTKEEVNNMIAKDGKDAFIYFCKQLDIPFIKYEYEKLKERYPGKPIFGRYLSKMKLASFRPYTWKDSKIFEKKNSMISFKENELYQEIELFVDDIKIGEAEVDIKNKMLSRLNIYSPYQDKGYGQEVVKKLIEKYGCNCLWVNATNERAIHVYEKNGFKKAKPTMYLMEISK